MTAAAIITAGGRGVRFGSGAPKQFAALGGKPLLAHSVETFSSLDIISEIVLVAPDDWVPYVEKDSRNSGSRVSRVVPGGAERQHFRKKTASTRFRARPTSL
ncbi:MAG: 2-C-methyl-D-erythritol 4-phosphate cytidylyltransferase [Thermodesulfobacteriota bacterium]